MLSFTLVRVLKAVSAAGTPTSRDLLSCLQNNKVIGHKTRRALKVISHQAQTDDLHLKIAVVGL